MPNQHVVPRDGGWAVQPAGGRRATALFDTQAEAIARGREIAITQGSELFVHRPNAQIRNRNSYGNDPFPPRG